MVIHIDGGSQLKPQTLRHFMTLIQILDLLARRVHLVHDRQHARRYKIKYPHLTLPSL
jgi:hypothetical protein